MIRRVCGGVRSLVVINRDTVDGNGGRWVSVSSGVAMDLCRVLALAVVAVVTVALAALVVTTGLRRKSDCE